MISVDKSKCLRCGACIRDCVVEVLKTDEEKVPYLPPELEKYCLNCQHCLAVCPTGAVSCNGISAENCQPIQSLPEPEKMLALLRQRRTVRFYKDENVSPEILEKLKESLAWIPTGCNDRSLVFKLVESREEMAFFREETSKMLKFLIKTGIMFLLYPRIKRFLSEILGGKDVIYRNAPHMLIAFVPDKAPCKEADPWIALSYFDLLVQSFGLGSCWCGFAVHAIRHNRKLKKYLNPPKGCKIAAVILFGKPDVTYQRATAPENFKFL
jgi:nitroreductase/NAD-dependent dihydropyrimidine dehydrogenase PreA subunit